MCIAVTAYAQENKLFDPAEHAKIELSEQKYWAAARLDGSIQLAPTDDYDITYHRFRWNIDPRVRYIKGSVTTVFRVTGSPFQTIHFDLSDTMHVDSIHYHNNTLPLTEPSGNILSINLPANVPQNSVDSITVFYSGKPAGSGFGSFEVKSHGDSAYGFDSSLWTLSEPYGSRDWWPGKMTLTDKIDSIDFYITVPSQYSVATNGLPVDTVVNGNFSTHHWRHRYPIANYLICLASSNYAFNLDTAQLPGRILPIYNFWYPEYMQNWLQYQPKYHDMLRLYTRLFGPYPFINEKYGHAQMLEDGGMEHQTMTFAYDDDFELIAHEMAHHWFGDKLTCDSWQDIWLNEGFAVYCTLLCYEFLSAPGDTHYYNIFLGEMHGNATSVTSGSIYVDDTSTSTRIFNTQLTYDKGASILHMLRWKMGDDNFFAALKSYIADPQLAYSFSSTDALKSHLEQASGLNLTSFLNEWYYGQGYPTYLVDWAQNASKLVSLKIGQSTSDPSSVSFYEMPVQVLFKNATNDTTVVLNDSTNNEEFNVQLSFSADSVFIDPNNWILHGPSQVTKVSSINGVESVVLSPNPFNNSFQVRYNPALLDIQSIVLYNMLGQEINTVIPAKNSSIINTDEPGLAPGVYLLRINSTTGIIMRKLVKQ